MLSSIRMTSIDIVLLHNENNIYYKKGILICKTMLFSVFSLYHIHDKFSISQSHIHDNFLKMEKISKQGRGYRASSFDTKYEITHKINESHINQKDAETFRSYLQPLSKKEDCRRRIVEIF